MASNIALENQHIVHFMPFSRVASCDDMTAGAPHSLRVSMGGAQRAVFLIIVNECSAGSSVAGATAWCAQCNQQAPGGTTQKVSFRYRIISASDTQGTIGEAYSISFGDVSDRIYEIEVDAANIGMDSGYEYVQLIVSDFATGQAIEGAYVCILQGLRHKRDALGTQTD